MLSYVFGGVGVAVAGAVAALKLSGLRSSWRFEDIPDQSGKIVICTGANSGIGFHFCRHMARKKAHVIMACRSKEKGQEAVNAILKEFPDASLELRIVDVSSKASIRTFAEGILKDFTRLDILVNNAGVMMAKTFLVDGIDNTFATNNFGPYLLTGILLPRLEATSGSRIVTVASAAHKSSSRISWETLNDPKLDSFSYKQDRYSVSKAMNILFARKLAEDLKTAGSKVLSVSCHPGYADTELQGRVDNVVVASIALAANKIIAQSAEMGAAPLLLAATGPDIKDTDYVGPCGFGQTVGWPERNNPVEGLALDKEYGEEAWQRAKEWTGFTYKY